MCQVTEMKSKLFPGLLLLAGIHFVVDHNDHKHSTGWGRVASMTNGTESERMPRRIERRPNQAL